MNKVYILIHGYHYEDSTSIVGVYNSESVAIREMLDELIDGEGFKIDLNNKTADNGLCYYRVEKHEVVGSEK